MIEGERRWREERMGRFVIVTVVFMEEIVVDIHRQYLNPEDAYFCRHPDFSTDYGY